MNGPSLVEVYRATNSPQAHLLKQLLAEAEIFATIENDHLQSVLGEVAAWEAAPRIMVESTDAPRARALLMRSERSTTTPVATSESSEAATCLACAAPMQEEDENCSVCGWSYNAGESEGEGQSTSA